MKYWIIMMMPPIMAIIIGTVLFMAAPPSALLEARYVDEPLELQEQGLRRVSRSAREDVD